MNHSHFEVYVPHTIADYSNGQYNGTKTVMSEHPTRGYGSQAEADADAATRTGAVVRHDTKDSAYHCYIEGCPGYLAEHYQRVSCAGGCGETTSKHYSDKSAWTCKACTIKAERAKSKRTREVFPTDEIPHLWAHQVQSYARNPQGNLYFRASVIYSYRDSFPVAAIVAGKVKGSKAYLVTTNTYSNTTSGHIHAVKMAIPAGSVRFDVSDVLTHTEYGKRLKNGIYQAYKAPRTSISHADNLAEYVKRIGQRVSKAGHARTNGEWSHREALSLLAEMKRYAEFFGITCVTFPEVSEDLNTIREQVKAADKAKRIADRKAAEKQAAKREALRMKQARAFMAEHPNYAVQWDGTMKHAQELWNVEYARVQDERRENWRREAMAHLTEWMSAIGREDVSAKWDGTYEQGAELRREWNDANREREQLERLEAWKRGENVDAPRIGDTLLRINPDDATEVETSRGARFPISHARLGLALVRRTMSRGHGWHQNGEQCRLGHYHIDRIDANGTVYAGCHTVTFAAIEAIASELDASYHAERFMQAKALHTSEADSNA